MTFRSMRCDLRKQAGELQLHPIPAVGAGSHAAKADAGAVALLAYCEYSLSARIALDGQRIARK